MKKIFCTTAMILGLLVGSPILSVGATSSTRPVASEMRFNQPLVHSAHFIGNTVRSSDGKDIGEVSQVLFDGKSGQIRYAVVSSGTISKTEHLVPWQAIKTDPEGRKIALDISADKFKQAPAGLAIGSENQAEQLHRFYGVAPYWEGKGAREPMRQKR